MTEPTQPNAAQNVAPEVDDNKIMAERREKLRELREQGVAYPNDFRPTHHAEDLQTQYAGTDKEALEANPLEVAIAGRMMLKRVMGKASFATVRDGSGQIQFFITPADVGQETYDAFKKWDMGDIVAARGVLFRTNKGELSVRCTELRLLSKSLRPLPDKFHGLADQEMKYRQRYVDLIVTPETRKTFIARTKAMSSIRKFMADADFMEVETPMLHPIPGGAAAKPFTTHHNALDMQMFLRIAPELYLKRLVVGGFERVFEINRNFRNEGVSVRHNPEFTMIEFYAAYTDYKWIMDFTEQLIRQAAVDALGSATITYQGRELDLAKPFHRLTISQAIQKYAPQYTDAQLSDDAFLRTELKKFGVDASQPQFLNAGVGALQLALFEETAESQLWEPTFIIDYPIEVSPLARASDKFDGITERFELFITGREIANGFSELNDPEDQAARFKKQVDQKDAGDEEAMFYDADYIRALEWMHAYPVITQLRSLEEAEFIERVRRQSHSGYELVAAFDDGKIVGVMGMRPVHTLARGAHLHIDDLVVDAAGRGSGVGRSLMEYAEIDARARGMSAIFLDARPDAIAFYERESYVLHAAPSMKKALTPPLPPPGAD